MRNLARHVAMLNPLGDETLMGFVREAAEVAQGAANETDEQTTAQIATLEEVLRQIRDLTAWGRSSSSHPDISLPLRIHTHGWPGYGWISDS